MATLMGAPVDRKDVEYGRPGGKALLLDLHVPDGPGPFPAAILVHGGGFDEGSKSTNCRPLFDVLANVKTNHVPYKGAAQALTDVIGGQLQYLITSPLVAMPPEPTFAPPAMASMSGVREAT